MAEDWLQKTFDETLPSAGYAVREEQLAMANFVQTALNRRRHLLAEAGVGTGKTFAYLIPLFAHVQRTGMPAIIATHTIALQEQLVLKDIPAVRALLDMPMQALLAKGKEHYLCPARTLAWKEATPEPSALEERVLTWTRRTRTGDRQEMPEIPEALWEKINLGEKRQCAGCRYEATCPTLNTRRRWQGAHGLIVTNHHQFFADLALGAHGHHRLFAQPGAIVLDEAHAVVDAAREMLGAQTSLPGMAAALSQAFGQLGAGDERAARAVAAQHAAFVQALISRIRWGASEEATRFGVTPDPALSEASQRLYDGLQGLVARLGGMRDTPARLRAIERLTQAAQPLRGLYAPERHITWIEGRSDRRTPELLRSVPRDLDLILSDRLFGRSAPVILTSATLSLDGDFSYLRRQLGVSDVLHCAVGSPFDMARQSRLYFADDLPDPSDDQDAFYVAALKRLEALLDATGGRALVLFTARSRSKQAFEALKKQARFPLLHQSRATPELLARFSRETDSVLLGTAFWEGIDVPGEALSCVVIVKLPFPPDDPLLDAEEAQAREAGLDPFEAVRLPAMLLRLKQGAGRLIRRESDRGVIAILDPRARSRERYREAVAACLPESPVLASLEAIAEFLAEPPLVGREAASPRD